MAGVAAYTPMFKAQEPAGASDDRHPITIAGCVRAGVDSGTFMLMNVEEVLTAGQVPRPHIDRFGRDVLYILILNSSDRRRLDKEVGRRVEVVGTVDLTDIENARLKITDDETKRIDREIEFKGDGQTVTVESDTTPGIVPDAAGSAQTATEPNRVLYRLHVKSIRRVPSRVCDSTVRFRQSPPRK